MDSIASRLFKQAKTHPNEPAYWVKQGSGWVQTSWSTYGEEVSTAARALITMGIGPGDFVCILGFNRPEWVITDLATMAAGAVPAGIYTTCSAPEVAYITQHCKAKVIVLEDKGQWDKINAERANLPDLKHVIMMKGADAIDDALVMTWEDFLAKAADTEASVVDERLAALKPDDLATLIYTSGTTGPPKAVMLSQDNLAWTASQAIALLDVGPSDVSLSYLPLSHIAEQMFSVHIPATSGEQIYFAESLAKLPDNLREVQPTIVFGVPRIWEKFYAAVNSKMKEASGMKAKIAGWAQGVGRRANAIKNAGGTPGGLLGMQYSLANKLVYSKVKPNLGLARARLCVTGAAPVSKEILEFFSGLDVVISEVYGQSEDTGPTTFNAPGRTRFGSVGPEFPGVNVKLAEDDEILVKGRNVFLGYLHDEAATKDALSDDGWLLTGDLGKFDEDGFMHITGRKKDIIITAGGKNIAPKNIELALTNHALVSQAVVIGDRRKFLSAVITLDPEAAKKFAAEHNITGDALHNDAAVIAAIQGVVDKVNPMFARVEHIRKFTILSRELSVEDGELTPSLKIKRSKVNEHFEKEIEAMYAD